MREFSISSFKAHALSILSAVAETKEKVLVTKRGKPLAYVVPYERAKAQSGMDKLAGTILFEGDIVLPLGADMWEAARDENPGGEGK